MLNAEVPTVSIQKETNGYLVYTLKPVRYNQFAGMAEAIQPLISPKDPMLEGLMGSQSEDQEVDPAVKYYVFTTFQAVLTFLETLNL